MFHTLQDHASRPAGLPKVNDIIRNKEKESARKDERRVVYSAVTARAESRLVFHCVCYTEDGERTVDVEAVVTDDLPDLTFLLEGVQSLTGETAVDLETINKGGDGDQTVGLDFLVESLKGGLLEDNSVLGLVLDCTKMSACCNLHRAPSSSNDFVRVSR